VVQIGLQKTARRTGARGRGSISVFFLKKYQNFGGVSTGREKIAHTSNTVLAKRRHINQTGNRDLTSEG
jgi:hypothetical protein